MSRAFIRKYFTQCFMHKTNFISDFIGKSLRQTMQLPFYYLWISRYYVHVIHRQLRQTEICKLPTEILADLIILGRPYRKQGLWKVNSLKSLICDSFKDRQNQKCNQKFIVARLGAKILRWVLLFFACWTGNTYKVYWLQQ